MRALLKNKTLWSITILVVFVVFFLHYVVANWDEFLSLELNRPYLLLLLGAGATVTLYSNGALMDVVLRPLGLHLQRLETFGLAAITRLGNQVAPGKFGLAIRAGYLKRKHGLALNKFASALGAAHILMYLFSSLLGLAALLVLKNASADLEASTAAVFLAGLSIFLLGLLVFSPQVKEGGNFFTRNVARVINGWFIIRQDQHTLQLACAWAAVHVLSMSVVIFASFNALGAEVGALGALFITSFVILTGLVGITPAGLGISEGLMVLAATVLGVPVSVALASALLRRVVSFVILVVITPLLTRKLFHASFQEVLQQHKK